MKYTSTSLSKIKIPTSVVCDSCDDLGITPKVLPRNFHPNKEGFHISGLVRTLEVVKHLEKDVRLYDSLKIFHSLNKDDIIVVSNDQENLSFWGELNTRLALQYQAQATVVGSVTRDSFQTKRLNYPVFSLGNSPLDVRCRAIVKSINSKIIISGIAIYPEDWLVGDDDGLVVVANRNIDRVYTRCLDIISIEKDIISEINKKMCPLEIYKKYGNF